MKVLRLIFFFLLAVVITVIGLSFFQSTYQQVIRTITIRATPEAIYNKLSKLDNFTRFSVWTNEDSSIKFTSSGNDAAVGAGTSWKGDPEISGEGKITITALEPGKKVAQDLEFIEPQKRKATSEFLIAATDVNQTEVKWIFRLATPRPWNVFNLFYSIDKEKGKDFEDGLKALKLMVESSNP